MLSSGRVEFFGHLCAAEVVAFGTCAEVKGGVDTGSLANGRSSTPALAMRAREASLRVAVFVRRY
jgi:hypothetical protein